MNRLGCRRLFLFTGGKEIRKAGKSRNRSGDQAIDQTDRQTDRKEKHMVELKEQDMQELYALLKMYNDVYGPLQAAGELLRDIQDRCIRRGIRADKHNTRGAGRKKTITAETCGAIVNLRAEGLTIREIAEQTGVSKSFVQKTLTDPIWGEVLRDVMPAN